ncbi:MAG: STAS domain-containing protein [Vicinamibacterales bacterium]
MDISQAQRGGATVVTLIGRLDAMSSPDLDRVLASIPDDARVVLDLAQLTYISSAGLRVLVALARRQGTGAGRVVLCALTPTVRQLLNITGLTGALMTADTLDDALASVAG